MTEELEVKELSKKFLKILLVEDNPADSRLVQEILKEIDGVKFEVDHVLMLSQAFEYLEDKDFDVVLLDLSLPDARALNTFVRVSDHSPTVPIIVLSSLNDEDLAIKAVQEGAQDYLVKGHVDGHILKRSINYAISRNEIMREHEKSIQKLKKNNESNFHSLIKNHVDAVVIIDKYGVIHYINKTGESLFGRKNEEMIGEIFKFPLDLNEGKEVQIISADGTEHIAAMRIVEANLERKNVYLASFRDLTKLKEIRRL